MYAQSFLGWYCLARRLRPRLFFSLLSILFLLGKTCESVANLRPKRADAYVDILRASPNLPVYFVIANKKHFYRNYVNNSERVVAAVSAVSKYLFACATIHGEGKGNLVKTGEENCLKYPKNRIEIINGENGDVFLLLALETTNFVSVHQFPLSFSSVFPLIFLAFILFSLATRFHFSIVLKFHVALLQKGIAAKSSRKTFFCSTFNHICLVKY